MHTSLEFIATEEWLFKEKWVRLKNMWAESKDKILKAKSLKMHNECRKWKKTKMEEKQSTITTYLKNVWKSYHKSKMMLVIMKLSNDIEYHSFCIILILIKCFYIQNFNLTALILYSSLANISLVV